MKQRKTPLRKCVITQEMKPKKELIRVVRSPENDVFLDPTSKKSGRGAYISNDLEVIEKAASTGALSRHLKTDIPDELYEELRRFHLRGRLLE
ncbi:RNase P modulator RnpM [Alkalicoccus urumqiensis]|uniref:DUF448 domain-containing protein n=1 Tax=Alkalicoccus urumqiensis TaxID=1548213 RepID=A0A2P6MFZ9_ALKUR|nr:YlxR family protein [Alkalicoccus urumqiensis]PRO65191.1 DUF448 domain-containing protein [Alkalicoccus urumqiensis]